MQTLLAFEQTLSECGTLVNRRESELGMHFSERVR